MEDAHLIQQVSLASAGDADALHALIVRYHPLLLRKIAAGFDPTLGRRIDPEDVLQHAYINAFQAIGGCRFDGPGGFYKWIESIALNELKNHKRALRRQKRDAGREAHSAAGGNGRGPLNQDTRQQFFERIAGGGTSPSGAFARNEFVGLLLGALARLGEEQRAVVQLRFLEGRRVAEVAAKLGKSEDAVHALCYRAMRALKESLGSISRFISGW